MWIWIFAIVVLFFVLDWFVAKRFDEIAQMKGQPPEAYFWWCFWLGVIGWAMVIALPDRAGTSPKSADSSDELPEDVYKRQVVVIGGFAVADGVKGRTVQPRLCPRSY